MSDQLPAEERSSQDETANPRTGVKRPLVPVVLALMLGLVAGRLGCAHPKKLAAGWVSRSFGNPVAVMDFAHFPEMTESCHTPQSQ
jgi:hypothetical protein